MAGKHHKRSRRRSSVARRGGTGLAAAAVSATSLSTAFVTGTTPAVAPAVELMALVSQANSTSQFFAGTNYYGTDWTNEYGEQQVVPFLLGPNGVAAAIRQHKDDEDPTGVTSSGWGAGQTGTALASMSDEDLENVDLVILDNNTNRAGGGFWTTYSIFAPLLLTSAEPTPNDLDVTVWDVGYEYNINGNAVTYPANVVSLANSLVAYVYGYGGEQTATLPTHMPDGVHYVVDTATGRIIEEYDLNDPEYGPRENPVTTTYVTFQSGTWDDKGTTSQADDEFVPDGPPLLRPLRLLPGGDIIADTLKPAVTEIVNAGYKDNQPIPEDPTVPRPMGLGIAETATMLNRLPGAIQQGLDDGAVTAQEDFSEPGNFVTKPIEEAGKLPFVSSLGGNNIAALGAKDAPTAKKTGISASTGSDRPRPLKRLADKLRKLAGGEQKDQPADEND
jgi:PE-PPE domain